MQWSVRLTASALRSALAQRPVCNYRALTSPKRYKIGPTTLDRPHVNAQYPRAVNSALHALSSNERVRSANFRFPCPLVRAVARDRCAPGAICARDQSRPMEMAQPAPTGQSVDRRREADPKRRKLSSSSATSEGYWLTSISAGTPAGYCFSQAFFIDPSSRFPRVSGDSDGALTAKG